MINVALGVQLERVLTHHLLDAEMMQNHLFPENQENSFTPAVMITVKSRIHN